MCVLSIYLFMYLSLFIYKGVLRQNEKPCTTVWASKLGLGKKRNIRCFLVIYYHLLNFKIIFSWLVVSSSASCCSISYRFFVYYQMCSHIPSYFMFWAKNPENTPDIYYTCYIYYIYKYYKTRNIKK